MSSNYELNCFICNGEPTVTSWISTTKGKEEDTKVEGPCIMGAEGTIEESLDNIRWGLSLFLRCKIDGPWDPDDPYTENVKCKACDYEREEILNQLYHYTKKIHDSYNTTN